MDELLLRCQEDRVIAQEGDAWPDFVGQPLDAVFAGVKDGALPPSETAMLHGPEGERPVSYSVHPSQHGFDLHIRDAEQERNRLARIIASERQLREAQEIGGIGSWQWDIVADEITWSDHLYRMYGLEPQEFPATFEAYIERIHPDDVELAQGVVQQAFQDMQPFSFDHRIVRKDGEVRWLHGQGAVTVEDGKPVRMFGVSQDITDARSAEEAAAREAAQQAELDRLAAVADAREQAFNILAHELKTPLTPMSLQLQLLRMGKLGDIPDEAARALAVIAKNMERLSRMTSEMLDVARISRGTFELHPEPVDLAKTLQEAVAPFALQAKEEGKHLDLQFDSAQVEVDSGRLNQVLANLVSNALKFTDEGGHIEVQARVEDDLSIIVKDDGLGMDETQRSRLFEPFARVHPEAGRPGTGLGLHVCKGIVEEHGGTLTCASAGPGQGTAFEVHLPVHARAAAPMT